MPSKDNQLSTEELTAWMKEYPYLTEEIFNAWYFATYINEIASAGKAIYPLPMYVNAWQKPLWHGSRVAIHLVVRKGILFKFGRLQHLISTSLRQTFI